MKTSNRKLIVAMFFAGFMMNLLPIISATAQAAQANQLLGCWQCQSQTGMSNLCFNSENMLDFDGEPAYYLMAPQSIRVQGDSGFIDYPYSLNESSLRITFPNGAQIQCQKKQVSSSSPEGTGGGKYTSSQNSYLYGLLCSWSGSSSSYAGSSYSRSTRVYFDGRGQFNYSSEASFSSNAGIAHGSGGNPTNSGRYNVQGNRVILIFNDGSQGLAAVHMQQNDGRITELKYEGTLYATGLCE